jgi:hypothetical protein
MPLKQVDIEVTDATSGNTLRAHWQNGITMVTLRPNDPPVTGLWNTDRAGDIDSNGGSDRATYEWDAKHNLLYLKVKLDGGGHNTLLTLRNVTDLRITLHGTGFVSLHGRNHAVRWRIHLRVTTSPVETTPPRIRDSKGNPAAISGDDLRNASAARAHIKAAEANPKRKIPELTQAENFARLISNRILQVKVLDEIARAHRLISTIK